jgi:hypothetical protein
MKRKLALALVVAFMYASLPAAAEDATLPAPPSALDAVSVKSLPPFLQHRSSLGLIPGFLKTNAAFPGGQSQPTEPSKPSQPAQPNQSSKQWTKGGKIMTVIGAALIAGGAVEMTQKNSTLAAGCSGNTCSSVSVDWRDTGIATIGVGAALVVIGLTRRR